MHRWESSCLWNGDLARLPRNRSSLCWEKWTNWLFWHLQVTFLKTPAVPCAAPAQCLFSTPLDQSVLDLIPDIFLEHLWEDIQNKEEALFTDRRQHILWLRKRQLLQGKRSLISFETLVDMSGRQLGIEALWWAQTSNAKEGLNSGQSPVLPQKHSEDKVWFFWFCLFVSFFPKAFRSAGGVRALWKGDGLSQQRLALQGRRMPGRDQPGLRGGCSLAEPSGFH